jgi:S-adenosylmethionine synthetase
MTLLKNWALQLTDIWHSVKEAHLHWQTAIHPQQTQLRHAQLLTEQYLQAELKKKTVQLEQDIALLKTRHESELDIYKARCQQDIKDYQHYLKALAQLKTSIKASYPTLPEAVVFGIHHHAKQLLNRMWECEDFEQKMHYEMQLLTFMTTVHEEARLHLEEGKKDKLPEKTLLLLQQLK